MFEMSNPPHPGEILKEEFLVPMNISITEAAKKLGISRRVLSEIVNKKAGISAAMSFKLGKAFSLKEEYFYMLQVQYDLAKAKKSVNLENVEVIYKAG